LSWRVFGFRGSSASLVNYFGLTELCDALARGQVEAAAALGEIAQRDPAPQFATAVPLLFQRLQATRWTQPALTLALQQIETSDPESVDGAAATIALFRFKIGVIPVIVACGLAGLAVTLLL